MEHSEIELISGRCTKILNLSIFYFLSVLSIIKLLKLPDVSLCGVSLDFQQCGLKQNFIRRKATYLCFLLDIVGALRRDVVS